MPTSVTGYLNRLDQLQNYTMQLNHRIRDLEIKQATNPREFMKQMSIMFTQRIRNGSFFKQLFRIIFQENRDFGANGDFRANRHS